MANLIVQKLIHPKDNEDFNKYYGKTNEYSGWKASLTQMTNPLGNLNNYYNLSEAFKSGDTFALTIKQKGDYDNIKLYLDSVEDSVI